RWPVRRNQGRCPLKDNLHESGRYPNLPAWQAETAEARAKRSGQPALYFDALLPSVATVRHLQARPDQRLSLLRHVEALRLYAAQHNGPLPRQLSDLSVPLPDDPFTGQPLRYELQEATAHLCGTPPAAEEKNADFHVHYEVTLQE